MKKILPLFSLLSLNYFGQQQTVDVFSCYDDRSDISLSECTNTEIDIIKNCIFFRGNTLFDINPQSDKNFHAHDEIHITADFHDKADDDHTHHYSTSNKADFEIAYMNAWWPNVFIKYDKLEIGNTLPLAVQQKVDAFFVAFAANPDNYHPNNTDPNKINPFLEWEIKVETTFKHLESGFEKTIFGFYYEDFQRDYANEEWDPVATPYIFRTRYAPPKEGKWQARTRIIVGDGLEVYLSDPYFFSVVDEGQHGFVKVHENKRNLKLDDRMIFPVGHNLGWAGFWEDYTPNNVVSDNFKLWQVFQNSWQTYANEGSRFARMHLHNKLADIEWEYVGNYKNRLNFAWELDKLIDLFEHEDLLVQFTLMMQDQLHQIAETNFRWDFDGTYDGNNYTNQNSNPPGYWSQLGLRNVVDYISNEESIKYLKQRMRYLISRYCYSTSIYQIDIHSEINIQIAHESHTRSHLLDNKNNYYDNSDDTKLKVYNYHSVMSDYIKNTLDHKEHLLSANYGGIPEITGGQNTSNLDPDNTFALENIDVIDFNLYGKSPDKLYIAQDNIINYSMYNIRNYYGQKPIILGETGSESEACWEDISQTNIADLMTMGFTGIAGFNTWFGVDKPQVFPPVKRAADHMNGDDVINTLSDGGGEWDIQAKRNNTLGSSKVNVYHHFYYKSSNRDKAVGFIKNNSYNYFNYGYKNCETFDPGDTTSKSDNILINTWQENDFFLLDFLENHNFRIHYYSFDDYVSSDCFNTDIYGHQKLHHPISASILWYVAYVEDCMNGMATHEDNQNNEIMQVDFEILDQVEKETEKPSNVLIVENKDNNRIEKQIESKHQGKISLDKNIGIRPNPSNNLFYIETNENSNIISVELTDLKGNILFRNLEKKINEEIDISFLSSGVYNLVILTTEKSENIKLIKL